MVRKLLILGVVVLAGLFVLKKTSLLSYAGTIWSNVRQEAQASVPTQLELDRIRHEIARMDDDIRGMVGPIAEHMASITRLKEDIEKGRASLAASKADVKTMIEDLDRGEEFLVYKVANGQSRKFTPEQVRRKVVSDGAACKRIEEHLATKEKVLAAKEQSLAATRSRLAKLIDSKRDFEVQLAELERREEELRVARLATTPEFDDSRPTEIRAAIDALRHRLTKQRHELELLESGVIPDSIDVRGTRTEQGSVDEVRAYVSGGSATKGGARTASR